MRISKNELLFWHIARGESEAQICIRFCMPVTIIADKIAEARLNTSLVEKFERWRATPSGEKINNHPLPTDFTKTNDLSFSENLQLSGLGRRRVALANRNFKRK